MPTNQIPANVLGWTSNPENGDGIDPFSSNHVDYSSANNTTIFGGEEVWIRFVITNPHAHYSTNTIRARLQLFDGTTPVPSSLFWVPSGTYTGGNTAYSAEGNAGLTTGDRNTGWMTNSDYSSWAAQGEGTIYSYTAKFKVRNGGHGTSGHEGICINDLKIGISAFADGSTTNSNDPIDICAYVITEVNIKKVFTMNTPENLGNPGIAAQPPIPSYVVGAWAWVEHDFYDAVNSWQVGYSAYLPIDSMIMGLNATNTYGQSFTDMWAQATVPGDIAWDNNGNFYAWTLPAAENGVTSYNQYPDGGQGSMVDKIRINSSLTQQGYTAGVYLSQTLNGSIGKFDVDDWYMVDVVLDENETNIGHSNIVVDSEGNTGYAAIWLSLIHI